MMRSVTARAVKATLLPFVLLFLGCVVVHNRAYVESIDPTGSPSVESPVRAHLLDLSSVFFADGVLLDGDTLRGQGSAASALMEDLGPRTAIPIDSPAGLEALNGEGVRWALSSALTVATWVAWTATMGTIAWCSNGGCE